MSWVMLNPSTADATKDDQNISRCVHYAKREGAGMISMVNLFALRSTDPTFLRTHPDPVGPLNDSFIEDMAEGARWVVFAWGSNTYARTSGRARVVTRIVQQTTRSILNPLCLGHTTDGSPKHPARLGNDVPLVPWRGAK